MKIPWQSYQDVTVVELRGDVDAETIEPLRNALTEIVAGPHMGVVLNMSEAEFIDSQGLELLLWVNDYCRRHRVPLRLAGLAEHCTKILEITRLLDEFDCHAELAEAVKSFA